MLLALLARRCPLALVGGAALQRSLGYLRNTGLLALRTLAIMGAGRGGGGLSTVVDEHASM